MCSAEENNIGNGTSLCKSPEPFVFHTDPPGVVVEHWLPGSEAYSFGHRDSRENDIALKNMGYLTVTSACITTNLLCSFVILEVVGGELRPALITLVGMFSAL